MHRSLRLFLMIWTVPMWVYPVPVLGFLAWMDLFDNPPHPIMIFIIGLIWWVFPVAFVLSIRG
jgi:hypothetical protein